MPIRPDPSVQSEPPRTLRVDGDAIRTVDQTLLPFERVDIALRDAAACARAIRSMQVMCWSGAATRCRSACFAGWHVANSRCRTNSTCIAPRRRRLS